MNVPFRLRCRTAPAQVAALWLASAEPRHLAHLCARLGGHWPDVYVLAGGYLVVPDDPPPAGLPRTVRLRRLANNLYLPADADLVPALHPAEAADLTRHRGLVFLPGQVLAFDPTRPLPVAAVVAPSNLKHEAWQPLPPRPERAERLVAIGYDGPSEPQAILDLGKPDGGNRAGPGEGEGSAGIRPPDAPLHRRAAGRAAAGVGQFLTWLGRVLHRPGLAKAGANLIRRAVERVPRLTEKILGRQEAALRELLRRFQAGDVEGALARAPAVANDGSRPGTIDSGWRLGRRNPRYSLSSLLEGGPRSVWLGGGNVWSQLAAEYRRLTREAADRGDYRRAAYIYGVLLRELRPAADVLAAGGLYHDAAVLYRDRLNDPRAAAAAFERAGDVDEALRLYRETGLCEQAGDLLRRLGDEDGAIGMYVTAADRRARTGGWLAAGDLLRDRAGRTDLALPYYRSGWEEPPAAVPCGERLLDHHVAAAEWPAVRRLLAEAEDRLAPPTRSADAGRFYAAVVRATNGPLTDELAQELRDRARLALAVHLRTPGGPRSAAVSDLFGSSDARPAPDVRDAAFAVGRPKPTTSGEPPPAPVPIGLVNGPVTAAVVARGSFDIVLGTAGGEVVVWRADNGQVERVTNRGGAVHALATDALARFVVTLHRDDDDGQLRSYYVADSGRFQYSAERDIEGAHDPVRLLPVIRSYYGDFHVDAVGIDGLVHFRGVRLVPESRAGIPIDLPFYDTLICPVPQGAWTWDGRQVGLLVEHHDVHVGFLGELKWRPAVPHFSSLTSPPIDWQMPKPGMIELTGITAEGDVYWTRVEVNRNTAGRTFEVQTACSTAPHTGDFRAAALLGPGRVVAVTASNTVYWWKVGADRFQQFAPPRRLPLPDRPVAAFARPVSDDVVMIFDAGTAVRLPVPG